jgi:hypothetical protein
MEIAKKEFPNNYAEPVVKVIKAMSLTNGAKIQIVGSMAMRSQQYAGDYDMNEEVPVSSLADAVGRFQKMIGNLLTMKELFIGDIKAGGISEEEPVRWTPKQVLKGSVDMNGKPYTLEDAFTSHYITKVDVIALNEEGRFADFSCIYTFTKDGKTLNSVPMNLKEGLRKDILEYSKEGNWFKVIKRIFSFEKAGKSMKLIRDMIPILNGDLGRIYSLQSDVATILYLLENEEVIPFEKIKHEIDGFRSRLGNIYQEKSLLRKEDTLLDKILRIPSLPNNEIGRDRLASILLSLFDTLEGILNTKGKDALSSIKLYPIPKEYLP